MNRQIEKRFSEFHNKWMTQTEEYIKELVKLLKKGENGSTVQEQKALILEIATHINEYYRVKWVAVSENVMMFFNPHWLTSLEMTCSWVTGWKPSSMFPVVEPDGKPNIPGAGELTEEQVRKIEELRIKIELEEEIVDKAMERRQTSMADPYMLECIQAVSEVMYGGEAVREVNGIPVGASDVIVMGGLDIIIRRADRARLETVKGILGILTLLQCARFLWGNFMIQVTLRKNGQQYDRERRSERQRQRQRQQNDDGDSDSSYSSYDDSENE